MNFEERKAEILRRSQLRIAQRKRSQRIALGLGSSALVLALAALPLTRLSQRSGNLESHLGSFPAHIGQTQPENMQEVLTTQATTQLQLSDEANAPLTSAANEADPGWSQPPACRLTTVEGARVSAALGGYYWEITTDGHTNALICDAPHPLDASFPMPSVTTAAPTLQLDRFSMAPARITCQCWPQESIGSFSTAPEAVTVSDSQALILLPGTYIYELSICWEPEASGVGGTVTYAFLATYEE